ncbi:MAG: sugar ABC transporter ATP-binding protein [Candidatus Limnocylindrales bacterium]
MTIAVAAAQLEARDMGSAVPLRAENVTKVFPGTTALDDVTFDVHAGKVNVLVGENGAGKSTLMKILAGVEQPTSGQVLVDGQPVHLTSVGVAAANGVGIIFQELNLCPNLSVLDNLFLAQELTRGGTIDRGSERARARELLARLGQDIDPDVIVSDLRVGQQQVVEIAKALTHDLRVLIMDEPTSALSQAEVEGLFKVIDDLRSQGVAIVYISHRLDELLRIGDRVTVLRDGRIVASEDAGGIDVDWIIEQMVGRNPASLFTRTEHALGETLLEAEDVTLPRVGGGYLLDHVSFSVRAGEILGFYGLMGAGRTELMEVLAGARPEATGVVRLGTSPVRGDTVADRIEQGIVLVPEDRKSDALVPTLTVAHNMVLASLRRYLERFWLAPRKERSAVTGMIRDLSIRVAGPDAPITSLSGGNQQKVVVAKSLLTEPRVLLLDEPTRGIDVGAKSEIFAIMSGLAEAGYAILFVSSELKEVLAMSDRIVVLAKGRITLDIARADATEARLVAASAPADRAAPRSARQPRPAAPEEEGRT